MPSYNKIGTVATSVATIDDVTVCRYHATDVVKIDRPNDVIVLNNGGYFTATTKARMNQVATVYNLKLWVFSDKGDWHVNLGNCNVVEFEQKTMTIPLAVEDRPIDPALLYRGIVEQLDNGKTIPEAFVGDWETLRDILQDWDKVPQANKEERARRAVALYLALKRG
jgi:hypothetical protein